jgi:hypothetical protein
MDRQGAREGAATGAQAHHRLIRNIATDTQNFHANLLPTRIRLNRSVYNATARLASLLPSNPIRVIFIRCRRVPRFHRSPIHHLIAVFPIFRGEFETIDPLRRFAPIPTLALSTSIASDKDEARAEMEKVTAKGVLRLHRWAGIRRRGRGSGGSDERRETRRTEAEAPGA